jgi:hypothetical protein
VKAATPEALRRDISKQNKSEQFQKFDGVFQFKTKRLKPLKFYHITFLFRWVKKLYLDRERKLHFFPP